MQVMKVDACPFCGGKSRAYKYLSHYYSRCLKCGAYSAPYKTLDEAIKEWNRRTQIPKSLVPAIQSLDLGGLEFDFLDELTEE